MPPDLRPGSDTPARTGRIWQDYWSNPGAARFVADPGTLAETMLRAAGAGPVLDVGCGDGALVHALLERGVDARGVDASAAAVGRAALIAPGRFTVANARELPFNDGAFHTIVCTFCLDTMTPEEIGPVLKEFRRVATHAVITMVRPGKDAAGLVRTVGGREWWEGRLFEAGFRRHPLCQRMTSFAARESEREAVTIYSQPLGDAIIARYPPEWLLANRLLHTDMLRESGRRSDAHIARYTLACEHVRPNDVVLDCACGMGYGALILATGSEASRVIGVDNSPTAVAYSRAILEGNGSPAEVHEADAARLAFLPDQSVDLVVSFETLEHVTDPGALLAEFRRVLTPGGRVIVSVPNDWADESGKDPNPHHLHVYTWDRLAAELAKEFLPERRWRQTAGGGSKLTDRPRQLDEFALGAPFDPPAAGAHEPPREPEAEWWLALAMKSPLGATTESYRETIFPTYGEQTFDDDAGPHDFHLSAFARDYDNPWLFRSLICIGPRMSHDFQRERLAREVIATARAGSPDRGGAICVLAYNVLASPTAERVAETLALIEDFEGSADDSAHSWRWRISNRYAAARLLVQRGDRGSAREQFLRCGGMDVMRFSPLLATKTIDALRRAGVISIADGDMAGARDAFKRGLEESRRVVQGSWVNIWGMPQRPQPYGMHEIAQVMDLGSRCASWLGVLDRVRTQPGQAWMLAQRQSIAEMLSWTQSLQRNGRWLEQQRANWERIAAERQTEIDRLKSWTEELSRALAWRDEQIAGMQAHTLSLEAWNAELTKAHAWHEEQRTNWEAASARGASQAAETAQWNESQRLSLEKTVAELTAQVEQAGRWTEELTRSVAWHQEHRANLEQSLGDVRNELEKTRVWAEELKAAVNWHGGQLAAAETRRAAAQADLEATRARVEELGAAVRWQAEQRSNWEAIATRHASALEEAARASELLRVRCRESEEIRDSFTLRLAQAESRIASISETIRKQEEFRNIILAEKTRLSAELGRVTSLPVHRFAMMRWRNRSKSRLPGGQPVNPPPPPES